MPPAATFQKYVMQCFAENTWNSRLKTSGSCSPTNPVLKGLLLELLDEFDLQSAPRFDLKRDDSADETETEDEALVYEE